MRTIKPRIGVLSFLMFVTCFVVAAPMVQQQKTSPSDETTSEVVAPSKTDKKLNFIQKIILKRAEKKMKKSSGEDEYRKQARASVIFGVLAAIPILGIFFMIISVIKGVGALKSQNTRTRRLAISGIVLGVLLTILVTGLVVHFGSRIPSSFCFAGC